MKLWALVFSEGGERAWLGDASLCWSKYREIPTSLGPRCNKGPRCAVDFVVASRLQRQPGTDRVVDDISIYSTLGVD